MVSEEQGSQTNTDCNPQFQFAPVNESTEEQQDQFSWNREPQVFQQQAEKDGQVSVVL
jgi:hypothetical protein